MGEQISPSELKFRFQPNKQLLATISISNPDDKRLAFKIKTTAPKRYVVRPSSGYVEPKSTMPIQIIMQAQKDFSAELQNCKDKFMVQTTPLADDEGVTADTFNKEQRQNLREHRLKVVLEGPQAPPSPVPEANEVDDSPGMSVGQMPSPVALSPAVPPAAAPSASAPADPRYKQTLQDLGLVSAENKTLKSQIDSLQRENVDLRRKLDSEAIKGHAPSVAASQTLAKPAKSFGLMYLILVAIIAFLVGHYCP